MSNKQGTKNGIDGAEEIPPDQRQHWMVPALIFGGLEFTIPVLMVGSVLIGSFSLKEVFVLLAIGLAIQWVGNALMGYMGSKTGRPSSTIARSSFGESQSRFVLSVLVTIVCLGWFSVQTSITGNAISSMMGIDYEKNRLIWAGITIILGLVFALPSIIGYNSMKWTDYLAVPAGFALIIAGLFYSFSKTGLEGVLSWQPDHNMTYATAINIILGVNVAQWLISADYTRYAKPRKKDNILIPIGIIGVGFPLFIVGAIMSVGVGTPDIVKVMISLGFPFWGFLILWLATWTSQMVNNYSMGLALANLFNSKTNKGRSILTFLGTVVAIGVSLSGIADHFIDFLMFSGILYAACSSVMMSDFFLVAKGEWKERASWNWIATGSMALGAIVGGLTQYVYTIGIPILHTFITTALVYAVVMRVTNKKHSDEQDINLSQEAELKQYE